MSGLTVKRQMSDPCLVRKQLFKQNYSPMQHTWNWEMQLKIVCAVCRCHKQGATYLYYRTRPDLIQLIMLHLMSHLKLLRLDLDGMILNM